jgi:N-acetylmuramoyl-L-alanine amidase
VGNPLRIRKWLAGAGLILLMATQISAEKNSISLSLGDLKVSSEIKVIEKNEAKFVNLPFLGKYLHIMTDWDPIGGNIYLRFGKLSFKMTEEATGYTVNGEDRQLTAAPFESDGQLWIPVEFLLRLGLIVKNEDNEALGLDWDDNYLIGIEAIKYQQRPAFLLVGTKEFKFDSFLLTGPDRLVIDLRAIKDHFSLDSSSIPENPIVKKIRFSRFGTDTLRLVFDLNKLTGYKLIRDPEHSNQVLLVFNYFVEEINFFQKDQERKVFIKSSFPAQYQVKVFNQPNRLIIDLDGATLVGNATPIAGDGEWISSVRMSQFNPQTVRVVLDLVGCAPCFVLHSREDPNLIEVKTVQNISRVKLDKADQGCKLTIESTGELVETINKLKNPERLRIDLDYSQLAPGLKTPDFKNEQIKGLRMVPVNQTMVRVEIDLNYYVGYDSQISPDRRQLTINFKRSPLMGKTLVLDAGHGGVDMGACGRQGTREKDINLDVILRLKDLLEEGGAKVVLTRNDDTFISLYERPFISNYLFADLFVSVHTNNHPDLNVQGIEVYYYQNRAEAKPLAKYVLDELMRHTGFKGLGVKTNDFIVIRETQMPAILVELGFLSNFQEESTIKTPEFRANAAMGIFQGIIDYCQK